MKSIVRAHVIVALLSVLLLIVTVAGLFVFIQKLHARSQLVIDARNQVASYEQNKRTLTQETAELADIKSRIDRLQQNIVTEDTTPTLLSSLETMAKNDNITFTLTSVAATTQTEKAPAKLHIDFSATGSFGDVQRFLGAVLSQPYEAQISRLSLYLTNSGTVKSTGSWQLLAGIDVISF